MMLLMMQHKARTSKEGDGPSSLGNCYWIRLHECFSLLLFGVSINYASIDDHIEYLGFVNWTYLAVSSLLSPH